MSFTVNLSTGSYILPDPNEPANWSTDLSQYLEDIGSIITGLVGQYDKGPLKSDILNNQASPVDVTGFLINTAAVGGFAQYIVVRTSGYETGQLWFYKSGGNWQISRMYQGEAYVTFSVVGGTGQVQYTSDSSGGSADHIYFTLKAFPASGT